MIGGVHARAWTALAVSAVVSFASGCFLSHERAPSTDAGSARRPLDAAVPPDAPAGDAARVCPPLRPHLLCADDVLFPAMRSFSLPLTFVQDICGETARCEVRVEGTSLYVTTSLCPAPEGADCIPRGALEIGCEVPPLPPAVYTVMANGAPATEILVDFDSREAPGPPFCTMLATIDACSASSPLAATMDQVDELCLSGSEAPDERSWIELRDGCAECPFYDGTCTVTVEPTGALEGRWNVRVYPRIFAGACDGPCDPSCAEHVRRCALPTLVTGDEYAVFLEGQVRPSFEFVAGVIDELPCGLGAP